MTDFRAIVFAVDTSPNDGVPSSRPLARVFAFSTMATLEEIEKPEAIKAAEMRNIQVGEKIHIHGPGYTRIFEIIGKQGGFIQMRRIGTENGPDPVISGQVSIPAGEVFVHVDHPGLKADAQISVLPKNCDVPYWVTISDGGFDIDIQTADVTPISFIWQVRL